MYLLNVEASDRLLTMCAHLLLVYYTLYSKQSPIMSSKHPNEPIDMLRDGERYMCRTFQIS